MNCPTCKAATKRIKVHDRPSFHFNECAECGWDDYDEQSEISRRNLAALVAEGLDDEFIGDPDDVLNHPDLCISLSVLTDPTDEDY
jgi:Zn ribbon nucleic-acid-binding protein